ncbi:hypothetical protein NQ317_005480 [Molorchus minor]|uniref:Uncharacterized protein n=1 Tax=Molorchus minor TaxID=1323400 RepID=A0ABQ9JU27_9CUCU|nr:hypothetical protein NQ317_005480 [Molorchus minor]
MENINKNHAREKANQNPEIRNLFLYREESVQTTLFDFLVDNTASQEDCTLNSHFPQLNSIPHIIITASLSGLSEEMQELADMLHATCVGETGTTDDAIDSARKGNFPDDDNFKCYIMCVMAQMACIDDDGIIDVEATIAVIPEEMKELAAPVIRKCDTQKGTTPCENAWLTHKCYYNTNSEGITETIRLTFWSNRIIIHISMQLCEDVEFYEFDLRDMRYEL